MTNGNIRCMPQAGISPCGACPIIPSSRHDDACRHPLRPPFAALGRARHRHPAGGGRIDRRQHCYRPADPDLVCGAYQPPFNPPNWIFAPVWTALYALMALGVFRILRLPVGTPGRRRALLVYHLQLLFNIGWSFAFFGANSPVAGLAVILPLIVLIAATIAAFRPLDRLASICSGPISPGSPSRRCSTPRSGG